ncbi:MAG: HAMP domain-containing sensor histidine kinase [Candidatus Omnitrophica bacterium]|nr:HAMP domain-containing sensor histidine kinase [Candidatus Omnitrophota bacterium]
MADKEKTEVLLAVTHDFNNPLSTINIAMRNLIDGIGGELSDIHTVIVKSCLATVDKLHKLIEDILNFSKEGFNRINLKREFFDLNLVIKDEIESVMQMAQERKLELRYNAPASEIRMWGDKNKLSRVVMNLVSNALKYTPKGGGIDVRLSADENAVELTVINSGPGITPEEIGRLFKKYERLDKHSNIEGTGLGLSIVKDIVDAHNGRITVESELDKKTEFKVILPKDLRGKLR